MLKYVGYKFFFLFDLSIWLRVFSFNFVYLFVLQYYFFYDFIVNKVRGKSGLLFNFDVYEDVRMISDVFVEKDEVSWL